MNSTYTTHLICAPQLEAVATIGALLITPGSQVEADTPLVLLHCAGQVLDVCAPEAGFVSEYHVRMNESIAANDLLLTMEIEEKPFDFLPMIEEEPTFVPACQQAYSQKPAVDQPRTPLQVESAAASLAARLGVDLTEVRSGPDGMIDDEAIYSHVRDVLIRWRKLRRLVAD